MLPLPFNDEGINLSNGEGTAEDDVTMAGGADVADWEAWELNMLTNGRVGNFGEKNCWGFSLAGGASERVLWNKEGVASIMGDWATDVVGLYRE